MNSAMKHLKQQITDAVSASLTSLSFPEKDFSLAPPKNPEFGDLSTNVSLLLTRDLNKPPLEIAQSIADELNKELLPKLINLYGIESPGLTSSLAIARYVKQLLE